MSKKLKKLLKELKPAHSDSKPQLPGQDLPGSRLDAQLPGRLMQRFDAYHSELLGRILTTLEIAVDDERKLKSLKDRVRETLTWFWAEIEWDEDLGIIPTAGKLTFKFMEEQLRDLKGSTVDLEEFTPPRPLKDYIKEHVVWMLGPESKRNETFATVLANLVALAVPEFRVQPLVKELNRLIGLTSASLWRDLCRTVDCVFKEKQGAAR
ncbi:hypothetical protein ES703_57169 [subsurface metagenome]